MLRFSVHQIRRGFVLIIVVLAACGGKSQSSPDAGGTGEEAVCTPLACGDTGGCGIVADGCGGMLTCLDDCECSGPEAVADCPSMPCMTATSCSAGACVYEPIRCGEVACECNTGDCQPDDLRSCGTTVCTPEVCDPQPSLVDGDMVFANQCTANAGRSCGTCNLGIETCDTDADAFVCDDISVAGIDSSAAECSESSLASFIFFDADYAGGNSDGSRAQPFVVLANAFEAADLRNAEGIVIGGSPIFTEPLVVVNGVSLHGGYTSAPDFARSLAEVPVWNVPESAREFPTDPQFPVRLIGLRASDITLPTVIENIQIITADLLTPVNFGPDNYGAHIASSPGLSLVNVEIQAGRGGPAIAGATGGNGPRNDALMNGGTGAQPSFIGSFCVDGGLTNAGAAAPGTICFDGSTRAGGGGGGGSASTTTRGAGGTAGAVLGQGGGFAGSGANPFIPSIATSANSGANATIVGLSGAPGTPGGTVLGEFWIAEANATPGGPGENGHGGGGGGGGHATDNGSGSCKYGGGGGGGGAGGCGGGGGAGTPGGNSFGIFMVDSSGMQIIGGSIVAGSGGPGAAGGGAGAGVVGGVGGPGFNQAFFDSGQRSGFGGAGGGGANGGLGGNSAGGSSFGAYCHDSTPIIDNTEIAAGAGGPGGTQATTPDGAIGSSIDSVDCVSL
tara:strand:- start:23417 stop:25441 length:2025 start_codon:yes stop_codon:yes gene_type:complete